MRNDNEWMIGKLYEEIDNLKAELSDAHMEIRQLNHELCQAENEISRLEQMLDSEGSHGY